MKLIVTATVVIEIEEDSTRKNNKQRLVEERRSARESGIIKYLEYALAGGEVVSYTHSMMKAS